MKTYKIILGAAVVLLLIGFVGSMHAEDELREEVRYCNMVEAGHWPDFRQSAHRCPEVRRSYNRNYYR